MKTVKLNNSGFVPMLIMLLIVIAVVIGFAYIRVLHNR
jgi:hypothetical protein